MSLEIFVAWIVIQACRRTPRDPRRLQLWNWVSLQTPGMPLY